MFVLFLCYFIVCCLMQEAQTLTAAQHFFNQALHGSRRLMSAFKTLGKKKGQRVLCNIFKVGLQSELVLSSSACATPFFCVCACVACYHPYTW